MDPSFFITGKGIFYTIGTSTKGKEVRVICVLTSVTIFVPTVIQLFRRLKLGKHWNNEKKCLSVFEARTPLDNSGIEGNKGDTYTYNIIYRETKVIPIHWYPYTYNRYLYFVFYLYFQNNIQNEDVTHTHTEVLY